MDERPRYSTEQISTYLERFYGAEARESVLKELISADILRRGLDTKEGRLILSNTIDLIRSNVMKIVRLSLDGFKKNMEEIEQAALQIGVAYDFMSGISMTLTQGEEHSKALDTLKK